MAVSRQPKRVARARLASASGCQMSSPSRIIHGKDAAA